MRTVSFRLSSLKKEEQFNIWVKCIFFYVWILLQSLMISERKMPSMCIFALYFRIQLIRLNILIACLAARNQRVIQEIEEINENLRILKKRVGSFDPASFMDHQYFMWNHVIKNSFSVLIFLKFEFLIWGLLNEDKLSDVPVTF